MNLKLGITSRFEPISSLEFEERDAKNFGQRVAVEVGPLEGSETKTSKVVDLPSKQIIGLFCRI